MKDLVYSFNASQGHKAFPPKYTNPHNFRFDEIGNLVHDSIEEIDTINWMVTGKIKSIIRKASSTKDNLYFDYDAQGNRIAKHNYTSANVWKHSTYYVRDAQGNVMSVYDKKLAGGGMSYKLNEQHIYGSSRLGMTNPGLEMIGAIASIDTTRMYLGFKHYELSNHLGNVLTTISDKKIQIGYTGCPMSLDFNSGNTTGMQTDNALLSTATQSLEVTPLSAFAGVNAVFTSTPGVTYNIQFTFNNNTTNATDGFVITAYDFDGTTYSNITNLQIGLPANGVNSYTYTAGPSTSFVKFYYTSGANVPTHSFYIDDLSICSPSSTPTPTVVDHFIADISSSTDYFAFGQEQWGRKYQSRSSVNGFGGGQRKDDDISGEGNSYSAEFWQYDPRLGRRWNLDPKPTFGVSDYACFLNNPIEYTDPDGDKVRFDDVKAFFKVIGKAIIDKGFRQQLLAQQRATRITTQTRTDNQGTEHSTNVEYDQYFHYSYNKQSENSLQKSADDMDAAFAQRNGDGTHSSANRFRVAFSDASEKIDSHGAGGAFIENGGPKSTSSKQMYKSGSIEITWGGSNGVENSSVSFYHGATLIPNSTIPLPVTGGGGPTSSLMSGIIIPFNYSKSAKIRMVISNSDNKTGDPAGFGIKATIRRP